MSKLLRKGMLNDAKFADDAVITDKRFSRFDDEVIAKYFNDEGKQAIREYIARQITAARLETPSLDWYREQYRQSIKKFEEATQLMESASRKLDALTSGEEKS